MDHGSLIAQLPVDRVLALATGDRLPSTGHGAALFADLAGFTPLTNALARSLGPRRGAEELTRHLNLVYDAVITQVHAYGGTVVDFSGDAVMCWFDDERPAGARPGVRRAVTCGAALQRAVAEVGALALPDGEAVTLSLKVAVAAGPAYRFAVGDPSARVVDVLAGATVARTAAGERAANPGDVVVDEHGVAALRGTATFAEWRTGADGAPVAVLSRLVDPAPVAPWPSLAPDEPALEAVLPWVDRAVRERAERRATELRASVALFVRIGGVDFDDPGAAAALDAYIRGVQAVLVRHAGTLVQVTVGDKGSYLYVAFGAPIAHEDLADRAVACALDLRDAALAPAGMDPPAMGLDQGVARTGSYGGVARSTYGVLGDATNVAARLMAAAGPGEILVTARVRRACRRSLVVADLPALAIKGHQEPVEIARVLERPLIGSDGRAFGALVARDAELSRLVGALEGAAGGSAGTVLVEGEAGVGKSHLVDAARRALLTRADVTWLTAATDETRRSSLHAFLPMLRDVFFQDLADDPETRRRLFDLGLEALGDELAARDGPEARETAEELRAGGVYLAALLGFRTPDSAYERHEPTTRFERCLRAVDALLRAQSRCRPLVVHVRDSHWLDDDSLRLTALLAESATKQPLCLLLDRRTDGTLDDRAAAPVPEPATRIGLHPLDARGVERLAASLLDGPVGAPLVEHLVVRTRGNPLFVEQLVLHLLDRGLVGLDDDGAWRMLGHGDGDIPLTLTAVLVSRLDRLPEPLRGAIQSAAVLGETFEPAVLGDLLGGESDGARGSGDGDRDHLTEVLAAGVTTGVWHRRDGGAYSFRHALLRDAAYEVQLDAQLRTLHRRAADAIAGRGGGGGVARSVTLAYHEERAGRPGRAAVHLRRAGAAAAAQFAYRDACTHLTRALALAARAGLGPLALARLHERLGDAAHAVGEYELCVEHLRCALDGDPSRPAAAAVGLWTRLGEALDRWGRDDEAETAFEAALEALQEAPDLATASRIYAGLAMVHGRRDQLDAAVDLAELALSFAGDDRDIGHTARAARARQCLCILECRRGRYDEASFHGTRSLALWEQLGDRHGVAAAHNNLGLVDAATGDADAAIPRFRAAVANFEAIGHEHGLACALDNLAGQLVHAGDDEAGMECLERAVEILSRIGMGSRGVVSAIWQGGGW